MTNEEKELLLKELCARLPHGVKYRTCLGDTFTLKKVDLETSTECYVDCAWRISDIKLYLRPMNSMTEDERYEYEGTRCQTFLENGESERSDTIDTYDWLNANGFDHRGLIEKGLSLEAPDGMYKNVTISI